MYVCKYIKKQNTIMDIYAKVNKKSTCKYEKIHKLTCNYDKTDLFAYLCLCIDLRDFVCKLELKVTCPKLAL